MVLLAPSYPALQRNYFRPARLCPVMNAKRALGDEQLQTERAKWATSRQSPYRRARGVRWRRRRRVPKFGSCNREAKAEPSEGEQVSSAVYYQADRGLAAAAPRSAEQNLPRRAVVPQRFLALVRVRVQSRAYASVASHLIEL
jgi:hypothetical protein